ncbi:hypothetical protein GCM10010170_021280 [Dactylosporangium salmoneum]|uniref:Putative restriction endonuclease domain-containing protein n=2 Tax=Dactylosporangium salmoneum TaxID=53361 RepID=A0ABP5SUR2_9ACTN
MPAIATLDDLAAMMAADPHGHRYELSPEGVLEIVSRGSEAVDKAAKPLEYAGAGIPQYWTVDRDAGQTVTMYRLVGDRYEMRAATPLAWVLNTSVTDHLSI